MQEFLAKHDVVVNEIVNATKEKLQGETALKLARMTSRVLVTKGKKVVTFDMKNNPPDDETLLKHLLGPTGNLRAPTVRRGKTLFVGFNAEELTPLFQNK